MGKSKARVEQTPIAFFLFAEAYLASAQALYADPPEVPHRNAPISFLYYQAIELYLKAFLRLHNVTTTELASRHLGHKLGALANRAEASGLSLKAPDKKALEFLEDSDAIESARYINVGWQRVLPPNKLDQLCRRLRHLIGEVFKKDGWPLRDLDPYPRRLGAQRVLQRRQ